jgi:branched-chain amino acid transport system substrate-binding protein
VHRSVRIRITASAAAAAACLVLGACSSNSSSGNSSGGTTYPVGFAVSLTGPYGIYGVPEQKGAELAVDELNSSHYLGQSQLKLTTSDDQSTVANAISAYKTLASDGSIGILYGFTTPLTTPLTQLAVSMKIPSIVTGATGEGVTAVPYAYRTVYLPEAAGGIYDQSIDAAATNWKPRTAVIVYDSDSDSFSGPVEQLWVNGANRNHITVLSQIAVLSSATDLSSVATTIVHDNPDLVIADTQANGTANLMRGLSQFGYKGHVLTNYGVDSKGAFNIGGAAMAGVTWAPVFSVLSKNSVSQEFVKAYEAKYGSAPDQFAAEGYNSINFLALGIKDAQGKGSVTRASLATALSGIKSWQSTNGDFTMSDGAAIYSGKAIFVQWNANGTQSVVWGQG